MSRDKALYDGHNRKPQKTSMRVIRQRRLRRRRRLALKLLIYCRLELEAAIDE